MRSGPFRLSARVAIFIASIAISAFATNAKLSLEPSGPFLAGDSVHVRWSGLPAGVEELEFLLIRFNRVQEVVRMTPQLDPRRGEFVWRVPALASDDAFLRLRVGTDDDEIEIAESIRFAIDSSNASDALEFREGEWWEAGHVEPWTAAPPAAIEQSHDQMSARLAVNASRVRARIPSFRVANEAPASRAVVTYAPARACSEAPLTIPQRK